MGLQFRQLFPEELSPVEHPPATHVKQIYRQHSIFVVISEHVGVIAFDGCNALLLLELVHGRDQIAILSGALVLFGFGGLLHALP
jgi:hypothetical protein